MSKLTRRKLVLLLMSLALLVAALVWVLNSNISQQTTPEYQQERLLRFSYEITNQNSVAIKNAKFSSYFPIEQMPSQLTKQVNTVNQYSLQKSDLGNQVAHFDLGFIPPYGKKIIKFTATIKTALEPNYLESSDQGLYLAAEQYIEKDAPEIKEVAETLKAKKDKDTVKNIYQWASNRIKYAGYVSSDKGALFAIKNLSGDCTEYMYAVIALARALDIPARGIGGYVYPNNAIVSPSDYHNWAEVYFDGRWHIVDAQKKSFSENNTDYIAMRILSDTSNSLLGSSHRFSTADDHLTVKMN